MPCCFGAHGFVMSAFCSQNPSSLRVLDSAVYLSIYLCVVHHTPFVFVSRFTCQTPRRARGPSSQRRPIRFGRAGMCPLSRGKLYIAVDTLLRRFFVFVCAGVRVFSICGRMIVFILCTHDLFFFFPGAICFLSILQSGRRSSQRSLDPRRQQDDSRSFRRSPHLF